MFFQQKYNCRFTHLNNKTKFEVCAVNANKPLLLFVTWLRGEHVIHMQIVIYIKCSLSQRELRKRYRIVSQSQKHE